MVLPPVIAPDTTLSAPAWGIYCLGCSHNRYYSLLKTCFVSKQPKQVDSETVFPGDRLADCWTLTKRFPHLNVTCWIKRSFLDSLKNSGQDFHAKLYTNLQSTIVGLENKKKHFIRVNNLTLNLKFGISNTNLETFIKHHFKHKNILQSFLQCTFKIWGSVRRIGVLDVQI